MIVMTEIVLHMLSFILVFAVEIEIFFQDKVSNIWCALSVVIKWKQVLSVNHIVLLW